jgi:hypothetical protein
MKKRKNPFSSNSTKYILRYAGLGAQMLVSLGLALFIGIKADAWLATAPLFTLALPLLVLAGIFIGLVKQTQGKKKNPGQDGI